VEHRERKPVVIVDHAGEGETWASAIRLIVRWIWSSLWARMFHRRSPEESAKKVRELMEQMGGLWVKTGQLLSLRSDLLSPTLCNELSQLQHRAVGFPFEQARRLIESELGCPLEEVFDEFDEAPMAAASVCQVHSARLRKEHARVAVKVQRPDIATKFGRDMTMLRVLVFLLKRLTQFPKESWNEMLWEMERIMLEEVDYRYEAANTIAMAKTLRKHKVYVPRVFEYSSRRLLVMEFVPGVLMSDFIEIGKRDRPRLNRWMAENHVETKEIGEQLFISFYRQLFEDNLFHGDLHPGNILLLRDSRVAFIDFGTVGSSNSHFLTMYMRGMEAIGEQDYSKGIDYLFLLCDRLPSQNMEPAKAVAVKAYQEWAARTTLERLSYYEKSIGNMSASAGKMLAPYKVVMSWQFLKVGRTWSTLDASLSFLLPDVRFPELLRTYFRGATVRGRKRMKKVGLGGGIAQIESFISEFTELRGGMVRATTVRYQAGLSRAGYVLWAAGKAFALLVGLRALLWILQVALHHETRTRVFSSPIVTKIVARLTPEFFEHHWIFTLIALILMIRSVRQVRRKLLAAERLESV
jgi:ubiquinone biosynthesis protein